MTAGTCPKCGHELIIRSECFHCGVIVARYRADPTPPPDESFEESKPGLFRRLYRIGRWCSLTSLALVAVLVLYRGTPPEIEITASATERAQLKVRDFRDDMRRGRDSTLQLDRSELNGWLDTNLALGRELPPTSAPRPAPSSAAAAAEPEPTLAEVRSSIRDVRIDLFEDRLRAWVAFELYGKLLSLELEGKVYAEGGYLRFDATSGRLGSLPLLESTLQKASRRLFDSPENREKLRLPPEISEVRVEHGTLVISTRRSLVDLIR
jgi:hypothetical protein